MYNRNMYITEDKYLPLEIEVDKYPIMFVGMNPGKTRKGKYSSHVWDGDTLTSNLLREAVEPYTNIVLTNVCNYQEVSEEKLNEGMNDLLQLVLRLKPRKIICLGDFAYKHVEELRMNGGEMYQRYAERHVIKLPHPSYVVRFNKNRQEYINKIRKELDDLHT